MYAVKRSGCVTPSVLYRLYVASKTPQPHHIQANLFLTERIHSARPTLGLWRASRFQTPVPLVGAEGQPEVPVPGGGGGGGTILLVVLVVVVSVSASLVVVVVDPVTVNGGGAGAVIVTVTVDGGGTASPTVTVYMTVE